jgi:DNA ligase-1
MMNSDSVFQRIFNIAGTPKRLFKIALIPKDDRHFKTVCVYALHPHYNYGVKKGLEKARGTGKKQFNATTWKILNNLKERKLTGNAAKNAVFSYLKSLTPASAELFKMILLKDLRAGISCKTINEVWPNLLPAEFVMKAEDYDPRRVTLPTYVSPKMDGLRATFKSDYNFYSSLGNLMFGYDHLIDVLEPIVGGLDGEMFVPDIPFEKRSGLIRNKKPIPSAEYWVFDIPLYGILEFHVRWKILQELFEKHERTLDLSKVHLMPHHLVTSLDAIEQWYHYYRRLGWEGVMIKNRHHVYRLAKTYDWMKLKPEETVDVKCTGVYEGTGRLVGKLGGILVLFHKQTVRVGSGFSDKERELFWNDPSEIVNWIVEVTITEKTAANSMRHGRFIRRRYDKTA